MFLETFLFSSMARSMLGCRCGLTARKEGAKNKTKPVHVPSAGTGVKVHWERPTVKSGSG